jgi:hypothetical protein
LAYASAVPRSSGTDDELNLSPITKDGQAATRAAYIARVVSSAPPIPDDVLDRLAVLLRPSSLPAAV